MSQPFMAEIRLFAFPFAPKSHAFCAGQLIPINQNQALFSLLGTNYGGDGVSTFGLPDLQGRAPIHVGNGAGPGLSQHQLGLKAGGETVAMAVANLPNHTHQLNSATPTVAAATQNVASPSATAFIGTSGPAATFETSGPAVQMSSMAIGMAGASQPIPNMKPNLVMNYCIALQGIFPSRN